MRSNSTRGSMSSMVAMSLVNLFMIRPGKENAYNLGKSPSVHPSLSAYPESGRGSSSLSRKTPTSLTCHPHQLLLEDTNVLLGKLRDIIPPEWAPEPPELAPLSVENQQALSSSPYF